MRAVKRKLLRWILDDLRDNPDDWVVAYKDDAQHFVNSSNGISLTLEYIGPKRVILVDLRTPSGDERLVVYCAVHLFGLPGKVWRTALSVKEVVARDEREALICDWFARTKKDRGGA